MTRAPVAAVEIWYNANVGTTMRTSSSGSRNVSQIKVDGLVYAIGQQQLVRLDSEIASDDSYHRLPLRITSNLVRSKFAQSLQHSRRAANRILVEIEAQTVASTEGRVIGRQIARKDSPATAELGVPERKSLPVGKYSSSSVS